MTDTANPVTGSQLTPMFATGAHGTLAPNTLATNTLATNTEPHSAPIFDTGPHPLPLGAEEPVRAEEPEPQEFSEPVDVSPRSVPARPVVVPGSYQFVSRWRFALILIGVWAVSAAAGLGLYHWWYTALDKTVPVAGILGYLIACMVASLLISLVPDRPRVTALAIVLMAAPLASTAAAAILHGAYYFEWIARPAIG
ncbi:MAG: hypothetical protein WCJ98_00165 [Mycobacteriaceae bacterium]